MKKLLLAALAVAVPAAAQDAPVKVFYQPAEGRNAYLVDKAMALLLERPGFVKAEKADAQALAVTVPKKAARVSSGDDVPFTFTLSFARAGQSIGEAEEECNTGNLTACADQLGTDITTAAAIRR